MVAAGVDHVGAIAQHQQRLHRTNLVSPLGQFYRLFESAELEGRVGIEQVAIVHATLDGRTQGEVVADRESQVRSRLVNDDLGHACAQPLNFQSRSRETAVASAVVNQVQLEAIARIVHVCQAF